MFRVLLVCALAATAFADVSHLFRNNRPFGSSTPLRVVSVAASRPLAPPAPIPRGSLNQVATVRQTQDLQPDGNYEFSYETENGIGAEERAQFRAVGNELEKSAQGQFFWTSPEGERVSVSYIADGNGYQPQGSHLPVAPPVPPAIQRALDWIAAHPEPAQPTYSAQPVYSARRF